MNIFSLVPYKDSKRHWIGKTAAQLRHLALLEPSVNLMPSQPVTREAFSRFIVNAFNLKPSQNVLQQPVDVNVSNMFFDSIITTLLVFIFSFQDY